MLENARFRRHRRSRTTIARIVAGCLLSPSIALAAPCTPASGGPTRSAPQDIAATLNLVLITVDTLRADRLGSYGYAEVETPHLDRLAGEGVRFDQVATTNPLTLPAHASLLTGRYPFRHGVRDNLNFRLATEESTLAEVLQAAGYATAAFVGASVLDLRTGIAQGFATYADPGRPVIPARARSPLQVERRGAEVVSEALEWIAGRTDPFFAWVHLFDPHAPYAAPAPFRERYPNRPYDGEVAYVDDVIGDLMQGLAGLGLDGDTLVVVTSDHGEGLGDHREQFHSLLIYDSTARVPLILWAPGRLPAGTVVRGQASIVDVMPTALSILGIADPQSASRDGIELRSLMDEPDAPGRPAYIESMLPLLQFGWSELRALRGNGIKYIAAPRPRLYDVLGDPGESVDLIGSRPEIADTFRAQLAQIAGADDIDDLEFGARFADPRSEATLRNLRALGYVTATAPPARRDRADPNEDVETLELSQRDSLIIERALANGQWQEADRHIEALESRLPDHPMVHFYRGRARLGEGRPADAIAALEIAVSLAVVNTAAWLDLAEAYRAAGDTAGAYDVLASAREVFPALAVFPLRRGHYLEQDGRVEEAEQAYVAARDLAPLNPTVWRRIADLYLRSGQLDKAATVLTELVALEPLASDAWSALADVECTLGRLSACEQARRSAVAGAPERTELYTKLAEVLLEQGEVDEAVTMFRAALRRDPGERAALEALRRLGFRDH
jgi:arylsulfatase A-like enzyme/Flp pilus assembly protein TadD